jgi:phosphoribosylformylglycinamidine synthase subunit PurS
MKFRVDVMPRKEALDPQGRTVLSSLQRLGFQAQDCRVGRVIEVEVSASNSADGEKQVREMAEKLLHNPLIESYKVTVLS